MSAAESSSAARRHSRKAIRKACTVCRTLKTRCLPSNDGQDDLAPCARCQRLELECDYTTKRRGRPITIGRRLANLPPPPRATPSKMENQTGAVPSVQRTESVQETGYIPDFGIEALPPVTVGHPPLPIGLADLQSVGVLPTYGDSSHAGWASGPIHTPSPFTVPDHRYEGMRGMVNSHAGDVCAGVASLEPHLGSEDSRSPTPELSRDEVKPQNPQTGAVFSDSGSVGTSAVPDMSNPVELGLLSEAEAMFLFQQFMDRMAPFAYMFDDAYHNFQFVRRSAVLLSATTAVMARFLRPDLFDLLRDHTELLINRQFRSGAMDLQAIQALLVLAFWKTPKDETAPLKMGLAVRAACLLHLKDHIMEPNTLDSLATREKLDRERTWSAILRMDTVCCLFNRLPASLAVFDNNEIYPFARWAEDHGHFGIAADSMIAYAFGLIGILQENCLSLVWPRPPERPIDVSKFDMKTLNATLQQHLNRWLATSALTGPYRSLAKIAANRFSGQLEAEQLRVRPSASGAEALVQAMSAGRDAITELAISGHLRFVSEHLATTILMPGLTLFHVRYLLPSTLLHRCAGILRDFVDLCVGAPLPQEEHALHPVARSYSRILGVFERLIASSSTRSSSDSGTQLRTSANLAGGQGGGEATGKQAASDLVWHDEYDGESFDALWESMLTLPL